MGSDIPHLDGLWVRSRLGAGVASSEGTRKYLLWWAGCWLAGRNLVYDWGQTSAVNDSDAGTDQNGRSWR